jgi:hypothetical protein
MGSNRKLAAGLVVANENFLFKIKKREACSRINHHNKELTFQNKKKKIGSRISCCQYRTYQNSKEKENRQLN